jgi:hypothetical protein
MTFRVDLSVSNDAAIGDGRPLNLRFADLVCRQETPLGVDRINVIKKTKRRLRVRQSQVRIEKRPHRPDVFPVSL